MQDSEERQYQSEADIYKRVKLLGSGSYGRAYLVQEKLSNEEFVIKQINIHDMTADQQEGALKEAKILQMLDHQNIVKFREVYRTAKMKLNIVMEYAGGGDLSQRIKTAKEGKMQFSEGQILCWFVQICLALRYIHSNKVIHRDLKAQNVFLTDEGLVKLGDFGVARVLEHTAARARTVVGSPYYISPEIIQNRPYSFKTDIWSLGALLYEMCALQPPFKANNLQFLALKIVQGAPPPLPRMYSEQLKWLVKSMLQTKQSNRPTIHQILSSKIIMDTIKKMNQVEEPPKRKPPVPHTISDFKKMTTLKPPPNLLDANITQNKSDIIQSKNMQEITEPSKAQTPQVMMKKGPNNFFNHRPVTGRKKVSSQKQENDLADLIQIKPSLIEKHEKMEKPIIPLPPVPKKISPTNKNVQQAVSQIKKQEKKQIVSPPSTAFTKKRPSCVQLEPEKKNILKVEEIKIGKAVSKKKEKVDQKKGSKKPQIRKKTYGASKKQQGECKLELFSEQAKKNQILERKVERKRSEKVIKRVEKKKEKKLNEQHGEQGAIMQEQKCNSEVTSNIESDDYFSNYYEEDFEEYEEYFDGSDDEDDLAYSLTGNEQNLNANFQKMKMELEQIQKIVEAGQDIQKASNLGDSIPELINFSGQIREDDNELDSNQGSKIVKVENTQQKIDLGCLQTPEELEVLRMKLQEIFGDENLIYAYSVIDQKLQEAGLNFSEEQVMEQILDNRKEISPNALHKYFGHIVAIISREKNFL